MADTAYHGRQDQPDVPVKRWNPLWLRAIKSHKLQEFAARTPILRQFVRADQKRIFDLMAGFAYSQILYAAVETDLFAQLMDGPKSVAVLRGLTPDGMPLLCRGAAGLGLLKEQRDGRYALTRRSAVIETVPGLKTMILHHAVLYRDLQNPKAVLDGSDKTEMAEFWPYVFGATDRTVSAEEAGLYSQVMSDTQMLVAREVLTQVDFKGVNKVLDVGGGQGVFARQLRTANPSLQTTVFDLPSVVAEVSDVETIPGNFRDDPLPTGFDAISLIRILFDHQDSTVSGLLSKVQSALPSGGCVIIAEPMAGQDHPTAEGDAYYALYTRAMQTGKTRRPQEIAKLLGTAGFDGIKIFPDRSPAVARVMVAKKPM